MLTIKSISAKNFLSIGAVSQSINFDLNELILIQGENIDLGGDSAGSKNGVGKSALINAVSYALYGQALNNIRKENLINKSNGKGMSVTIEFDIDKIAYKIERGRKPNFLRFFKNNVEQSKDVESENTDSAQGDSRDTQQDITKLLGMSHDMFKHIVALNTYTEPFLDMRVNDQREIIEQLLGITLLSEKAEKLKEEIKKVKDEIHTENITIKATQSANLRIQTQITNLISKKKLWSTSKRKNIEDLSSAIETLSNIDITEELAAHQKLEFYSSKLAEYTNFNNSIKQLQDQIAREERSLTKIEKELSSLEKMVCNSCGQQVKQDNYEKLVANKQQELQNQHMVIAELVSAKVELEVELGVLGDLEDKPKTYYKTVNEAYDHKNQLNLLEQQLLQKSEEQDPYSEQITDMQNTALQEISFDEINALNSVLDHQEFLLKLLTNKDSFIRKKIIDQNLSYLNSRLSHYLDLMGMPHNVVFLNDLSVSITELGRDLDFHNLSRGEGSRLILSLSWAFRDVWESLYKPINIILIDEILDSGGDQAMLEASMSVLKSFTRDRKKSIWLISHKEELTPRVDNILKVTKENGFTTYEMQS